MRVRVEIEVELHPQGDKEGDRIHSRVRAQATSRGLPNEKRLSAGLLRELQPTIESLRRDVHDAVIRRVAHDVYARNVTIHDGFSAWRPIPPNADDVREHPWWWNRMPDGDLRVTCLKVTRGNDILDVESGLIIEHGNSPGDWAPCTPPPYPDPAR